MFGFNLICKEVSFNDYEPIVIKVDTYDKLKQLLTSKIPRFCFEAPMSIPSKYLVKVECTDKQGNEVFVSADDEEGIGIVEPGNFSASVLKLLTNAVFAHMSHNYFDSFRIMYKAICFDKAQASVVEWKGRKETAEALAQLRENNIRICNVDEAGNAFVYINIGVKNCCPIEEKGVVTCRPYGCFGSSVLEFIKKHTLDFFLHYFVDFAQGKWY